MFDVLLIYFGTRIIIRYEPRKFEHVYIYDTLKKQIIFNERTDKIENSKIGRVEINY